MGSQGPIMHTQPKSKLFKSMYLALTPPAITTTTTTTQDHNNGEIEISSQAETLCDAFFGFFENASENSSNSSNEDFNYEELENEDEPCVDIEENKKYWESQEQILQATLSRTSSIELKIRRATKECLRELKSENFHCVCIRPATGDCRDCLRREVCSRLRRNGFDSAICKSKWRSSPEIPSGEHTYLEVVDGSSPKKREVKVIIELNFRAEFEMARASDEYKKLISLLPEALVGKADRFRALIKILCSAAKKCMKEKKIHIGPWRKHKYMQAKWLGTLERSTSLPLTGGASDHPPPMKPKASMLTFDLVNNMPSLNCTAVAVV